jgi:hypothetical protein
MSSDQDEPFQNKEFPSHPDLEHAGKHVATLSCFAYRPDGRGFVPEEGELTSTVTFLEIAGKTYAVTAAHVVDQLNKTAKKYGMPEGSFYAPKAPGVSISGPFLVPPKDLAARTPPDVALRPIPAGLPGHIGKTSFVVTADNCVSGNISHGRAVGFPTARKVDVADDHGLYSSMQCVHAVAEHVHQNVDQINFRSFIENFSEHGSLSGMSGSAVFWSDEGNYGLAGITIEAIDPEPGKSLIDVPMVQFIAQRVDFQTLLDWAAYADENWQKERDKLNEKIKAQNLAQAAQPQPASS